MAGVGRSGGAKWRQLYLNNSKKKKKEIKFITYTEKKKEVQVITWACEWCLEHVYVAAGGAVLWD